MISIPYFKQIIKSNCKFLCAFTLVLCIFLIVMTNVFTPETVSNLQAATQGTIAAHILTGNGTLVSFMSNFLCADGHRFSYGIFHHGRKPDDRRKN